ncbi:MAG: hypothetical protein HZB91_00545 [Elusimicrobia bacterium]|nr:hypothetical protein [Elusimicrobiota bacterium]
MAPSERERRTRLLALAGAAALVLIPLLWFLAAKALERWTPAAPASRGDVFARKPSAGNPVPTTPAQAPAPAPAASPAPVPPAAILTNPPSPPIAAPAPATATFEPPEPGTVLKVVEVRHPERPETETPSRLPKLKPMKGWTPTEVRGLQDRTADTEQSEPVYYLPAKSAPVQTQPPAAAKAQPPQATAAPAASAPAAAPRPKPVLKPVPVHVKEEPPASERKPLPPVLTTTIGPGGPVGTMDHVPPGAGQDTQPLAPSPQPSEPARPDGTCGRAGWWRNSWTQSCHPTIDGCRAADSSGACTQQR